KITLKGHFKMLYELIVFSILLIPFMVYIFRNLSDPEIKFAGFAFLILFLLVFYLPTFNIHYGYYSINKNKEYHLLHETLLIRNLCDGNEKMFLKKDVTKVILNISSKKNENKGFTFLTIKDYYYIKVI